MIDVFETTIKWYKFSDWMPPKSGMYLVVTRAGSITDLSYSLEYNMFNVSTGKLETAIEVVYWANIPNELYD